MTIERTVPVRTVRTISHHIIIAIMREEEVEEKKQSLTTTFGDTIPVADPRRRRRRRHDDPQQQKHPTITILDRMNINSANKAQNLPFIDSFDPTTTYNTGFNCLA